MGWLQLAIQVRFNNDVVERDKRIVIEALEGDIQILGRYLVLLKIFTYGRVNVLNLLLDTLLKKQMWQ